MDSETCKNLEIMKGDSRFCQSCLVLFVVFRHSSFNLKPVTTVLGTELILCCNFRRMMYLETEFFYIIYGL